MDYKYYVQQCAKERAGSVLPVPDSYSLRGNFGPDFISDFSKLTKILVNIYLDVAENPEIYECELYPLTQEPRGRGTDNESNGSLDRIVKCLRTLCDCGEMNNRVLAVRAADFNKQIKKIKNHSAVIKKLKGFGFEFPENIYDKTAENFFVSFPGNSGIVHALKIYMDCWNEVLTDEYLKSEIKKNGYGCIAYYYGFYLFDYKVTANPKELTAEQLVKDDCYAWDEDSKNIYKDFGQRLLYRKKTNMYFLL